MADCTETTDHILLLCTKCRGVEAAAELRASLREDLPSGFVIRAVDCMAGCDRKPTIGLQAPGKASYLFGEIESAEDIAAIVAFSHQYQSSADGWTSATDRPAALYDKTLARMPALKSEVRE